MGESKLAGQFFDAAIGLLKEVRDGDSEEIAAAGAAIAEAVANGNRLFAFGAGHSSSPPRTSSTGPAASPS